MGPGNVTDHLVRKLAHFCEYGVLGIILGALALLWKTPSAFFRGSYAFLLALATAVVDESIQLVADGRGAQVQDILLDADRSSDGVAVGRPSAAGSQQIGVRLSSCISRHDTRAVECCDDMTLLRKLWKSKFTEKLGTHQI